MRISLKNINLISRVSNKTNVCCYTTVKLNVLKKDIYAVRCKQTFNSEMYDREKFLVSNNNNKGQRSVTYRPDVKQKQV